MFEDVDVTAWRIEHVETVGRKRKMWLLDPTGDAWLYKQATQNRHLDGTVFWKGDDWAEVVVAAVAGEMGIPAASYRLAHLEEGETTLPGVISRKMVDDDESLIEGNAVLEDIGIAAESVRDRRGYTLDNVRAALTGIAPPATEPLLSSWEWFVGFLVLDALVGNTDRHQQNWAVIQDSDRRLAPTFDHASSLGFLLHDSTRRARLTAIDPGFNVMAYASKATTKFEGNPTTRAIAALALQMVETSAREHWLQRVTAIESLDSILASVPASRISEPAASFAAAVFQANRTALRETP